MGHLALTAASALLHIASVLTQFDHERAVRVFDEGLSLARTLPETNKQIILGEAVFLAASIDPERAIGLLQEGLTNVPHPGPMANLILMMLDHGHLNKAIGYLIGPMKAGEFAGNRADNPEEPIWAGTVNAGWQPTSWSKPKSLSV